MAGPAARRLAALLALGLAAAAPKHRPYIELLLDGQPLQPRIEFDLTVSLRLQGFSLTIQDGRIKAIHTGTLEGKGTLGLHGARLLDRPLGKVTLPGKIPLGDGIALD